MAVPTLLPSEATPLDAGRKRRHSEFIDLTVDDGVATAERAPATNPESETRQDGSADHVKQETEGEEYDDGGDDGDQDDEDERTLWEQMVDHFEDQPFTNDGSTGVSVEQAAALRAQLRQVGPEEFFEQTLDAMTPAQLGTVFGLDPSLAVADEETFLRVLGVAVMRTFYRRQKLQNYNTIDDAAELLKRSRNITVITGAGISTSLGIPDFRSRGTGFYEKIREMGYSDPEEVFDIRNFDENPGIFYSLAGDILPDQKRFSPTHAFIRLLQDEDKLQTNYTQNIDNLEELAGIDANRIIQCHGSFASASCRKCHFQVKGTEIFDDIRAQRVAQCKRCIEDIRKAEQAARPPRKRKKSRSRYSSSDSDEDDDIPQPGVMKPDITFFGEQLPNTFFDRFTQRDAQQTDLVIVMGSSLKVAPVSEMPNHLPHAVPHIYISREPIKHVEFDIQLLGNCDDVVFELCRRAGWQLQHEMLPAGFQVTVHPENLHHHWRLTPRAQAVCAAELEDEEEEAPEEIQESLVPEEVNRKGQAQALPCAPPTQTSPEVPSRK
ncbi:related to histone deacetylase SIR2 [Lecanosticta acicola]|uniref:Related to histone deacetylase SIR2 n=1 Tax=Lecanosticta acicola TaxID=111012 RepID=A0AAI8Z5K2_9PEZI|nr:related to histone deacetylase SIR2 [Lecanosticta acicola]